jgi:hypothetical protein
MSPDDERRPRPEAPPPRTTNDTKYARPHRHSTAAAHPRFCAADVLRRRRFSRQLDVLLAEMYPKAPVEPSTFSLSDAELRRHGNDLHAAGWSIEEILTVLAIELAS